jgi:rhodanese-related sulfurtransferase
MHESAMPAGRHFTREEIRRRLRDPMLVIANVLPRVSWEEQRIPGSISLPLEEIPERARERLPDREHEIAVYCGGPT